MKTLTVDNPGQKSLRIFSSFLFFDIGNYKSTHIPPPPIPTPPKTMLFVKKCNRQGEGGEGDLKVERNFVWDCTEDVIVCGD